MMFKQIAVLFFLSYPILAHAQEDESKLKKQNTYLKKSQQNIDALDRSYRENLTQYYELRKKIALTNAYHRWLAEEIEAMEKSIKKSKRDIASMKELKMNSIDILSKTNDITIVDPVTALSKLIDKLFSELSNGAKISSQTIIINDKEKVSEIKLGNIARYAVNKEADRYYLYKDDQWQILQEPAKSYLMEAYKDIIEHRVDSLSKFPVEVIK